jgi:uncharacterized protein YndB with AHSA1/START domain
MAREYSVALSIGFPPQRVWDLLVDAPGYKTWNASVVSIDGPIDAGRTIKLVSAVNPGRTFALKVTAMDRRHRMVWTGGMPLGLFTGTRSFLIEPDGRGMPLLDVRGLHRPAGKTHLQVDTGPQRLLQAVRPKPEDRSRASGSVKLRITLPTHD